MFERFIEHKLKLNELFSVFIYVFFMTSFLFSIALYFEISFYAFLILIAVTLSYPFTQFLKHDDNKELFHKQSELSLLQRHARELLATWTIFLALVFGFFVALSYAQFVPTNLQDFSIGLTGLLNETVEFLPLLINNLGIFFLAFLLSFISISALFFIVQWCALLFALKMYQLGQVMPILTLTLLSLSSTLLEVGGYIIAGFCGILLSLRFDIHKKKFKTSVDKQLLKDITILLSIGIVFIIIGVILETV
ncbi:MAG: hypothetical protein ACLFPL_03660 [Candidatus Nanoarchaeia archaeon]